ncbi:hypothetical protein PVAND_005174 [Polypedilum vanderplanki]|uniref:Choline/carnitine acyltransferase domain-containing protein n=1 Tax=Polypedilum vanderplanki TaxID=319348 RepID=A0A9J6C0C2_POLVA|nr:hypothetical protein PVAND_005174 [Polypedilum vanderplanki]
MNRENLFILPDGSPSTFSRDESLEKLPLPKLEDTLERYYKNLLPFGDENELKNSRKIIEEFKNGVGKKLHKMLEEKAAKEKNWVEKFWEDYAYHSFRLPLAPYSSMVMPFMLKLVGVDESRENRLKSIARVAFYSMECWNLLRNEKFRPAMSVDGKIVFSSDQLRRLYNTARVPGDLKDEINCYFKTKTEGECSSKIVVIGKGKIFYFDALHDGKIVSPQEFLHALTLIRDKIENDKFERGIPILTCDERTNWSKNRNHLKELSQENEEFLKIIESSALVISLDDNEPRDVSELSQKTSVGDHYSRWHDKCSSFVSFKNGKIGSVGEHSCFDGTASNAPYILLSFMEESEPDWDEKLELKILPKEIKFKIDDHLKSEILRVEEFTKVIEKSLIVRFEEFRDFGKSKMKEFKIHPDCFVQMALQLAYYLNMNGELAPTYETATMRSYYHGRTETVRSCSIEVKEWLEKMYDDNVTNTEKVKLFKTAANSQFKLMNDARNGKGFDRHLFALWCIAYENNFPIPELYNDPLYTKSGGGGNFVLSTSTLGYFINIGYVAPMIQDGFGIFYTIHDEKVWIVISSYRESEKTSSKKFYDSFSNAMIEIKEMLGNLQNKL